MEDLDFHSIELSLPFMSCRSYGRLSIASLWKRSHQEIPPSTTKDLEMGGSDPPPRRRIWSWGGRPPPYDEGFGAGGGGGGIS